MEHVFGGPSVTGPWNLPVLPYDAPRSNGYVFGSCVQCRHWPVRDVRDIVVADAAVCERDPT